MDNDSIYHRGPVVDVFEIGIMIWAMVVSFIIGLFDEPWWLAIAAVIWRVFYYCCRNCRLVAHRYD